MNNINFFTIVNNLSGTGTGNIGNLDNKDFTKSLADAVHRLSEKNKTGTDEKFSAAQGKNISSTKAKISGGENVDDINNGLSYVKNDLDSAKSELTDLEIMISLVESNLIDEKDLEKFDFANMDMQVNGMSLMEQINAFLASQEDPAELLAIPDTYISRFEETLKMAQELLSDLSKEQAMLSQQINNGEKEYNSKQTATLEVSGIDGSVDDEVLLIDIDIKPTETAVNNTTGMAIDDDNIVNTTAQNIMGSETSTDMITDKDIVDKKMFTDVNVNVESSKKDKADKVDEFPDRLKDKTDIAKVDVKKTDKPLLEPVKDENGFFEKDVEVLDYQNNEKKLSVDKSIPQVQQKITTVESPDKPNVVDAQEKLIPGGSVKSVELASEAAEETDVDLVQSKVSLVDENSDDAGGADAGKQEKHENQDKQEKENKNNIVTAKTEKTVFDSIVENRKNIEKESVKIEKTDDAVSSFTQQNNATATDLKETAQVKTSESVMRWEAAKDAVNFAKLIQQAGQNGVTKLTVRLMPEHLGRIEIQLVESAGKLTARISADRPESKQLLASQADLIRQNLAEKGIQIDNMDFAFHDSQSRQEQEKQNEAAKHTNKVTDKVANDVDENETLNGKIKPNDGRVYA